VSFITDADITDVGIINSTVKSLTLAESNDYTWKVRGWTGSAWGDWSYSVGFRYLQDSDDPGASSGISDVKWVDGSYDDAYGTQYNRFTSTNTAGFTATELFENFEIRKGSESNRAFPKRLPGNTTTPKDYDFSVVGSNQFFVRGEQSADSVLTDWFPSDTKQSHPGAPDAPSYYEGAPTHIFNSGWVNPTGGSPSHWRDDGQLYIIVKIPARCAAIVFQKQYKYLFESSKTEYGNPVFSTAWAAMTEQRISTPFTTNNRGLADSVSFSLRPPRVNGVFYVRTAIWAINVKGESDRKGHYHELPFTVDEDNNIIPGTPTGGTNEQRASTSGGVNGGSGGSTSWNETPTLGGGAGSTPSPNSQNPSSGFGGSPIPVGDPGAEYPLPASGGGEDSDPVNIPSPTGARFAWILSITSTAYPASLDGFIIGEDFSTWRGQLITVDPLNGVVKFDIPRKDLASALNGMGLDAAERFMAENDGDKPVSSTGTPEPGAGWAQGLALAEASRTRYMIAYYDSGGTFLSSTSVVDIRRSRLAGDPTATYSGALLGQISTPFIAPYINPPTIPPSVTP